MKKLLSLLLTLAMLLSMVAVSAVSVSANDGAAATEDDRIYKDIPTDESITVYKIDNVEYNIIRDADDFLAMGESGNYILANDISLEGKTAPSDMYGFFKNAAGDAYRQIWDVVLEGNNCSITNVDFSGTNSIFGLVYGGDFVVRNLTFGSDATPLVIDSPNDNNNGTAVVVSAMDNDAALTCENVDVYAKHAAVVGDNMAGFVGYLKDGAVSATFTNCNASVEIETASGQSNYAGFVGKLNGTAEFENCNSTVTLTPSNSVSGVGGFVGLQNGGGSRLINCIADVEVKESSGLTIQYAGGFMGRQAAGTSDFDYCTANATINASSDVGGFIGELYVGTSTFDYCSADVDLYATGSRVGGFIGARNTSGVAAEAIITTCQVTGKLQSASSFVGGFVARVAKGFVVTLKDCVCYADVAANSYAGGATGASVTGGTLNVTNFLHDGNVTTTAGYVGGMDPNIIANKTIYDISNVFTTFASGTNTLEASLINVVTAEQIASGEVAFLLGDAFGQEIGVDATPVLGGAEVTKRVLGETTYYANLLPDKGEATEVYIQYTDDNDGVRSHRILVRVNEADIEGATGINFKIKYNLKAGGAKSLTVKSLKEISFFKVINADNGLYTGADGTVIMAVVIDDVPTADYSSIDVTMSITGGAAEVAANANIPNVF